ncbi:MAG TPA: helix-turn-helix transcriptional regulator [Solirubrobacterales bacterium]|nr:helix-turn-helix transcriptional regulator [Solirubrobacterales bacterium]
MVALDRTLGANLRLCREAAELTQEQLAHLADLHPTYISLLERGQRNPGFEITVKLIGALGIAADDLYRGARWIPPDVGMEGRFAYDRDGAPADPCPSRLKLADQPKGTED